MKTDDKSTKAQELKDLEKMFTKHKGKVTSIGKDNPEKELKTVDFILVDQSTAAKAFKNEKQALERIAAEVNVSVEFLIGKIAKYQIEI